MSQTRVDDVSLLLDEIDTVTDDVRSRRKRSASVSASQSVSGDSKLHAESKGVVYSKTAAYFWIFFIIGLVQGVTGVSLNILQRHASTTRQWIETLVVARSVGWLLGSLSGGYLVSFLQAQKVLDSFLFW